MKMETFLMITGATGGLGIAFAIECAQRGYDLCMTDLHENGAEFARSLAENYKVRVKYIPCDMTSAQARSDFYQTLADEGLHFWGLINVAGLDYEGGFLNRSREEVIKIVRLNIESTLDTTHAILDLRDVQKRFRLINVCSLAAYTPMPYKAVYAASKRFLLDFSLAIREEIQPFGTVTALCPAGMPTTPENMRAIFAQGFWGKITTVEQSEVARQTMDCALRGKVVCIPGWINQVIQSMSDLLPVSWRMGVIKQRWQQAQSSAVEYRNGLPVIKKKSNSLGILKINLTT
jgi:uncharacterized protein